MSTEAQPVPATAVPAPNVVMMPIEWLQTAPWNARETFDPERLAELAASINEKGILAPLLVRLVRPKTPGVKITPREEDRRYEIIAGERRYRACRGLGLAALPVIVRQDLDDAEAHELGLTDNLQREDLHALEEAKGYQQLLKMGHGIDTIAASLGKRTKYVYDRAKLLALTKEAQDIFRNGWITAGHAILLARLSPADQKRAIGSPGGGPLLFDENLLGLPYERRSEFGKADPAPRYRAISVRELGAWIDEHVRFDRRAVDPMLFPQSALRLKVSEEQREKVVQVCYEHTTPEEAKVAGEGKLYLVGGWKRADGEFGSKTCDKSVMGVIVIGFGRGQAFKVCVAKEACATHWREWQRERKQREVKSVGSSKPATAKDTWEVDRRKREEARKRAEAARARWQKALPAILEAIAVAVKRAPATASSQLGDLVLKASSYGLGAGQAPKYLPRGSSAEDLVRHAAFIVLVREAHDWQARENFPRRAKQFGVDVAKILEKVAPERPPQMSARPPAKGKKKAKRRAA